MLIHLSEVLSLEGRVKEYTVSYEKDEIAVGGRMYRILQKEPFSIRLENKGEQKVGITACPKLTLEMFCDRCLEPVPVEIDMDMEREVDLSETEEERIRQMDEQIDIIGKQLDVDRMIETEIYLHLPAKVLCSPDCRGICDRCGANLNRETCNCQEEPKDPRMAAILDIFRSAT